MLLFAALYSLQTSSAATRIWDGGGTNGFWDTAANWSNNATPVKGDALIFPDNASRLINTNRASAGITNLSSLRFSGGGYEFFSPPLNLTNGLTNAVSVFNNDPNFLNGVIQPRANQSWSVSGGRTRLTLNSNVTFLTTPLTLTLNVGSANSLQLNGSFLGNASVDLLKLGSGTLDLNGKSNVVDELVIGDGIINVDGFLTATLIVSNGASFQGTGSVSRFLCAGDLRPGGTSAGSLTARIGNSCSFLPGSRLFVNLNGLTSGTEYDQIQTFGRPDLSGAELIVQLNPSFEFRVDQKFVIINNNSNNVGFATSFTNLPPNARITNNGIVFQISYSGGTGNDVELTVVDAPFLPTGVQSVWKGFPGTQNVGWSNQFNWVNNAIPKRGDDLVFPSITFFGLRSMSNDFDTVRAQFNFLCFGGDTTSWFLHGDDVKIFGGVVGTNEFLPRGVADFRCASIELMTSQTWSATNFFFDVRAPLLFGGHTLTLAVEPASAANFEREMIGPGTLIIREGFIDLPFNLPMSNLAVRIEGGVVNANEAQATGPEWELIDGQLSFRSAQIPGLHASGGLLEYFGTSHATIAGDLTLSSACTLLAIFENPTDQPLLVTGNVNLNNAHLTAGPDDLSLFGVPLTLINNAGTNAINGTFAGLPEGARIQLNDDEAFVYVSQISYTGGDGNDVTLTPITVVPFFTNVERLGNGVVILDGTARPGITVKIEAAQDFGSFQVIGTAPTDDEGYFTYTDNPGTLTRRFYRAVGQ